MSLITRNAKEYWLHNKCHKIYLSGPFGIFSLNVILTISYLRAQTIETSSLPTNSSRSLFKQIEIFFLTYWLYISTVSTFLNIRASLLRCLLGISPSGRNPYGGNKYSSYPFLLALIIPMVPMNTLLITINTNGVYLRVLDNRSPSNRLPRESSMAWERKKGGGDRGLRSGYPPSAHLQLSCNAYVNNLSIR